VRACAWCQKEFGIPALPGQTHGICRRHALEQAAELDPDWAAKIRERPDEMFAPELKPPALESVLLVHWLLDEQSGVYISASLTPESHDRLLERIPPVHPWVHAHHMTMAFNPEVERLEEIYRPMIGQTMRLPVIGQARDEHGQAARVEARSENENPHITISCAEGVPAKYSNDLLAKGWERIDPFELQAVIEARTIN
jgi:hypothetical protein